MTRHGVHQLDRDRGGQHLLRCATKRLAGREAERSPNALPAFGARGRNGGGTGGPARVMLRRDDDEDWTELSAGKG